MILFETRSFMLSHSFLQKSFKKVSQKSFNNFYRNHGKSSHKKAPPVLAKKAAAKQVAANRKISIATTSLVHPSKTSSDLIRRGSHGGTLI